MKLRSLIGFCALAVASVAVAEDIVGNTCGLMNVPSTTEATMIAVPWLNVGGGAVEVAKLVKTDTLTAGDELYYYDGANYNRWVLEDGSWTPTITSNASGTFEAPDSKYGLARGKGLFIVRKDTSKEIWLYGQADTETVSVTIQAGAYNMIANPNTTAYDIAGVDGGVGDQVIVYDAAGKQILYTKDGTGWYRMAPSTTGVTIGGVTRYPSVKTYSGCTIPAGQGAWYVSKSPATPTINW